MVLFCFLHFNKNIQVISKHFQNTIHLLFFFLVPNEKSQHCLFGSNCCRRAFTITFAYFIYSFDLSPTRWGCLITSNSYVLWKKFPVKHILSLISLQGRQNPPERDKDFSGLKNNCLHCQGKENIKPRV